MHKEDVGAAAEVSAIVNRIVAMFSRTASSQLELVLEAQKKHFVDNVSDSKGKRTRYAVDPMKGRSAKEGGQGR